MKFAKVVFWAAASWAARTRTPLYFLLDAIGRKDPPPITPPGFYYGFVGTALAWQIAFFIIARNPAPYRALIIPSIFEKFSYAIAITTLVAQARTNRSDLLFAGVDALLGVL